MWQGDIGEWATTRRRHIIKCPQNPKNIARRKNAVEELKKLMKEKEIKNISPLHPPLGYQLVDSVDEGPVLVWLGRNQKDKDVWHRVDNPEYAYAYRYIAKKIVPMRVEFETLVLSYDVIPALIDLGDYPQFKDHDRVRVIIEKIEEVDE